MSMTSRISDLAHAKLVGRTVDIAGFVDELLAAADAGAIRCSLASEASLRFEIGSEWCEVEIDACRGKLRMLCARLSALCNESGGPPVSPYGGEGTIRPARFNVHPQAWSVRFKNTPDAQELSISVAAAVAG